MSDHALPMRPPQADGFPDDLLEEINRLWTIVRGFSTTAHDVNNALQVIAGSAELLESRDLDPLVRRRVEAIRAESAKAAVAIDRLLSYARRPRPSRQRLDLRPLLDAAIAMRTASLGRMRIAIAVARHDTAPVWVVGEEPRLLQVLLNLLLIAEDMVAGRPRARLDVNADREADHGVVTIVAAGDGMAQHASADAADGEPESAAAQFNRHVQAWAAARIAAEQGARLDLTASALVLRWPAE